MTISVIMRTKDADWVVDHALRALFSQTVRDFELVVVDSGSTDRTLSIVRGYPCKLLQIPASAYIPGAVLNMAIAEARGDVLVFQNSDTVPLVPQALSRLVSALDEPGVVAAFARQVPRPEAHGWVRRDYAVSFPEKGPAPPWMALSLPFAAMRREAWARHPFHTAAWGSEDVEWGVWARRQGLTIRYVPESLVMHSHNYTPREAYGRRFIEGEADAFIHGEKDTPARLVRRVLASTARDMVHCLATGDLRGLAFSPLLRTAYHYGYFRGHKHGERRLQGAEADADLGRRVVLERHGGAGAREDR